MGRWRRRAGGGALAVAVVMAPVAAFPTAALAAVSPDADLIISEVYGGGGGASSTYLNDYVELYNAGDATIDLGGYSLQYASSAGTSWSSQSDLSGSLAPGELFVVQLGTAGTGGVAVPDVDLVGSTTVNLSGTNGNVALVSSTTRLSCVTTACASDPAVVDLVGYGTGGAFAGTAGAPTTSATTSATRDVDFTNTADNAADFTVAAPTPGAPAAVVEPPADPVARTIQEIQGSGSASPFEGTAVITRGVVTAVYATGGYAGFVIQSPGTGGTLPEAHDGSDAVFVYQPTGAVGVALGDHVEVTGTVVEFNFLTEIAVEGPGDVVVLDEAAAPVTPVSGPWPTTEAEREDLESMLYLPTGPLTVSNTFTTNQYGEVGLAAGELPLIQPTDVARPGSPEYALVEADNANRALVLDDGATTDYLAPGNGDLTPPYVSLAEPLQVGASVTFTDPVILSWGFNRWRLQPTLPLTGADTPDDGVVFENTRTAAPDAALLGDGDLTVASFNVLNYFTTLGTEDAACVAFTDPDGEGVTVRTGCDQRGAWDAEDLARQEAKIVAAINATDASVTGLMEIENSLVVDGVADEAVASLVAALNEAAGSQRWAYVPSSDELPDAAEMDVIANALIYQPAEVELVGGMRVLGELSGAGEAFDNAREPIGAAFTAVGEGGEPFFVAVNHFKSKGSGSGENADQGDGQGASNPDRVEQATALRDWVPTVLDDYPVTVDDVFLVGDFNAYTEEDPMHVLYAAGYVDANAELNGVGEFSYSFQGLSGSLDHVLVNASALERLTGADIWEINADEALALEYSRYGYHGTLFHEDGPYRSSDHNPVIVAFESGLDPEPVTFPDVTPENEFADEISWVVQQGIAQGYADGLFRPTWPVSRQAMAAFLYRMVHDGADAPACEAPAFPDVLPGDEFCGEIAWMVAEGLATGYEDGLYRPTAPVSRQATAAFLYRLATGQDALPACDAAPFPDVTTTNQFCGAIAWLVAEEIATGYADGLFHPTWAVSRQAMSAWLFRTGQLT